LAANFIVVALSVILILIVLFLYLVSRNKYQDLIKPLNKKDYAFLFMLPAGLYIMDLMKYTFSERDRKLRDHFSELHTDKYALYYLKIHIANKISTVLVFVLVFSFLSLVLNMQNTNIIDQEPLVYLSDNMIYRPEFNPEEFWGGRYRLDVEVQVDGSSFERSIDVSMQLPDDRTSVELVVHHLEEYFIRPNLYRFEEGVYSDLHFQNFARLGCSIVLVAEYEQHYVAEDGVIIRPRSDVTEPAEVNVRFVVSKGDVVAETFAFNIRVLPYFEEITLADEVDRMIYEINSQESEAYGSNYISLPTELQGERVLWRQPSEPQDNTAIMLFVGGLFVVMLMFFLMDSNVDKKVKLKRDRIKNDFPEFISKYVLLLGCGMTTYDSFRKIMDDSMNLIKSRDRHPIYAELETTLREIELGKAEVYAYEDFGLRCRINEAMKFASLVTQNLRRGTDDLQLLLRKQVNDVWEMHKADMRRRGEEAGTKMMFPMMLSLVSVLLVVIYPILTNVTF